MLASIVQVIGALLIMAVVIGGAFLFVGLYSIKQNNRKPKG